MSTLNSIINSISSFVSMESIFDEMYSIENVRPILKKAGYSDIEIKDIFSLGWERYKEELPTEFYDSELDIKGFIGDYLGSCIEKGEKEIPYSIDDFSSKFWKKLVEISAPKKVIYGVMIKEKWYKEHMFRITVAKIVSKLK